MNGLLAAQMAFCFAVLLVCGLFVASFERPAQQPTGFVAERLLTLETVTRNNQPRPEVYWEEVRRRLQEVSGVESVALCGWALLSGNDWTEAIGRNGRLEENEEAYFLSISPGWLRTMRIPLLAGRDFGREDKSLGTAIVNEAFARRYFEGRDPVGKTFERMGAHGLERALIVGYARDARYRDMREPIRPTVYVPFAHLGEADWATFVVRTTGSNPLTLAPRVQQEVRRARPEFRVAHLRTQAELVEQHTLRERLLVGLSVFFAGVALLLAGLGLYGVLSYGVVERRREIGIRLALGSPRAGLLRRIASDVVAMLLLGAALGISAGVASERYLESLLYQVRARDPLMLALPALAVFAAALLAALPPLARALRVDPAQTLRGD